MMAVKTAKDCMRQELVTLHPSLNVLEGIKHLLKRNISGAPVIDSDGDYWGVFSEKCSINALTGMVEAVQPQLSVGTVYGFMVTDLVTLHPDADVFEAIDHMLSRRISGAPVVDSEGLYCGVFSEKTAMRVLISAAYDQLPGTNVEAYMDSDSKRIVSQDASLLEVAHKFQQTSYRRLPVLIDGQLAGQVSRRDLLRAELGLTDQFARKENSCEELANLPNSTQAYMDVNAVTVGLDADILEIAQLFLSTPYRRLPVIEDNKLIGQISRRDLLDTAAGMLRPNLPHSDGRSTLYLSPLTETQPPSLG